MLGFPDMLALAMKTIYERLTYHVGKDNEKNITPGPGSKLFRATQAYQL